MFSECGRFYVAFPVIMMPSTAHTGEHEAYTAVVLLYCVGFQLQHNQYYTLLLTYSLTQVNMKPTLRLYCVGFQLQHNQYYTLILTHSLANDISH